MIRTFIVDADPIFRVGIRAWLQNYPEFGVIEDMGDGESAFPQLQKYLKKEDSVPPLMVLGGPLQILGEQSTQIYTRLMEGCRELKQTDPRVIVVIVGAEDRATMVAAQRAEANGYACKTWHPNDLLDCLRDIRTGAFVWPDNLMASSHDGASGLDQEDTPSPPPSSFTRPRSTPHPENRGPWVQWRFRLRLSGVAQIDAQLNQLLPYLQSLSSNTHQYVSVVDRWIIAGRCRELKAARWLVVRLLATPSLEVLEVNGVLVRWQKRLRAIAQQPIYQATTNEPLSSRKDENAANEVSRSSLSSEAKPHSSLVPSSADVPVAVRATLFDALRDRLQSPLLNQTEHPLEIDILREEKKRELLVLILHKILVLLDDLRYSEVQPQQLQERRSQLFYDLWQAILTDYFGKYYVVQVDGIEQEVVTILTQDARAVQEAIFDRIPFAVDLFAHFLFKSPLDIDSVPYSLGTPEAFERAELLLDNLVIQMANSIIYPLLNHLSDVELIKQNFYQRQLMSSREIARFRNTLSWHYRRKQWLDEPTAIFESCYALFTLNGMGIKQVSIYASRRIELDRLSGLPLLVTLLLEFRDALSPRFRGAIAALGSSIIYVLTDVIGRAIGLVGRGIIKGIGSAWKDPKQ